MARDRNDGTQVNSQGHLMIGGCDAVALAKRYGTPLYVVDEMAIRNACRAHRREFESRYPRVRITVQQAKR